MLRQEECFEWSWLSLQVVSMVEFYWKYIIIMKFCIPILCKLISKSIKKVLADKFFAALRYLYLQNYKGRIQEVIPVLLVNFLWCSYKNF